MNLSTAINAYTVPKAVALKLNELGVLLCTVGDEEAGILLKDVCSSPDLLSLRTAFLKVGRSNQSSNAIETPLETEISPKELWLREFASLEGHRLSDDERCHILHAIKDWIPDRPDPARQEDLSAWHQDPSIICTGRPRPSSNSLIGLYFDEYELIEKMQCLNPTRRKVILMNTFAAVEAEEQRLRAYKKTKRPHGRVPKIRTEAINELAQRAWGLRGIPVDEYKRRKRKLTRMSRYGEKWNLIRPRSMVLYLRGTSTFFEQEKWSELEIEAINRYLEAELSSMKDLLDGAMTAITNEWSRLQTQTVRTPITNECYSQRSQDVSRPCDESIDVDAFAGPGTGEPQSSEPGGNSDSIRALLNAAEQIAGFTPSQQLTLMGNPSVEDHVGQTPPESLTSVGTHLLTNEEACNRWDATVSGQPEYWSNEGDPLAMEPYFWSDGGEAMVSGQPDMWVNGGDPVFRREFDIFRSVTQDQSPLPG
ncbi:hypothetical protein DL98DRAFT_661242 [Cadophora sp. DSE1049]|nr:hypothetical protein DL98DRAFT_661242 [Cadophora sp. DSE1049]